MVMVLFSVFCSYKIIESKCPVIFVHHVLRALSHGGKVVRSIEVPATTYDCEDGCMEAKLFGGRGQGKGVRIASRRISLPKLKISEFRKNLDSD